MRSPSPSPLKQLEGEPGLGTDLPHVLGGHCPPRGLCHRRQSDRSENTGGHRWSGPVAVDGGLETLTTPLTTVLVLLPGAQGCSRPASRDQLPRSFQLCRAEILATNTRPPQTARERRLDTEKMLGLFGLLILPGRRCPLGCAVGQALSLPGYYGPFSSLGPWGKPPWVRNLVICIRHESGRSWARQGGGLWKEWGDMGAAMGHACPRVGRGRKGQQWEQEPLGKLKQPGPFQREPEAPSAHSMALVLWTPR